MELAASPESLDYPPSRESPIDRPVLPGAVISGKYRVLRRIGAGGMGQVFSAIHLDLGQRVALKFLRREALAHPELVQRFAAEARAAARIRSEHVARVFDVGQLADGVPFIVMELLEGDNLAELLARHGALPIEVAVDYALEVCEALASAHAKGVVHRDVKPENLFLAQHAGPRRVIKVLDFGVSKLSVESGLAGDRREFVRTTLPVGSPAYMSPEQIRGSAEVDARTDVWSLGCTLFELLTAKVPFDAPTVVQLGVAILEQEPVRLSAELPSAPRALESVIARCLCKNPSQRFADVAELARALAPFASERARIYAERCSFLLPAEKPEVAASGDPELAPRPTLSSVPGTTLPAQARVALDGKRPRLRRFGYAVLVLTALALAHAVGRRAQPTTPLATQPSPAAAPAAPLEQTAPPTRLEPPTRAATGTSDVAAPVEGRAAANVAAAPAPRTDTPAPVERAAPAALPQARPAPVPPKNKVFGRTRDEAFDVGY